MYANPLPFRIFCIIAIIALSIFLYRCAPKTIESTQTHQCGTTCDPVAVAVAIDGLTAPENKQHFNIQIIVDSNFIPFDYSLIETELNYRFREVCTFSVSNVYYSLLPGFDDVYEGDDNLPFVPREKTFYIYMLKPSRFGYLGYVNMPITRFDLIKDDSEYWKTYIGYRNKYDDILTVVHEFGHLFGLPHTFDGECNHTNDDICEHRIMSYDNGAHRFVAHENETMKRFLNFRL